MRSHRSIISFALVSFAGFLPSANAQPVDNLAAESHGAMEGIVRTAPARPAFEIRPVAQPAFAWAVGQWTDAESVRNDAADFRSGGHFVRIVPDEALKRYRLSIGHYVSEAEARKDIIRLPMTVRPTAEIVRIERHVVFSMPKSPQAETEAVTVTAAVTDPERHNVPVDSAPHRNSESPQVTQDLPRGPLLGPIEMQLFASTVFDSNIHHDQDDLVSSVGFVPGLMFRYRSSNARPVLVASYGVSTHQYTQTDKWDRTSHMVVVRLKPRLTTLRTETLFQVAKNGSFEDRDVSDQIQVVQEFELRVTRNYRLHAYGTLRWKSPDVGDDDAFKPNVGVVMEQRLDGGRTWEMGARYELNLEEVDRGNYRRWTFELGYDIPLSARSELKLGIKHRRKYYENRYVEIEDEDYLRWDTRWILGGGMEFVVIRNVLATANYRYEARTSNDPEKPFSSHLLDFGIYVLL